MSTQNGNDFDVVADQKAKKKLVEYISPEAQNRVEGVLTSLRNVCYQISNDKGFHSRDDQVIKNQPTPDLAEHARLAIRAMKVALIHSELSEGLEGFRKDFDQPSDHIGGLGVTQLEEELADAIIRIMDFCGKNNLNIGRAVIMKMDFNTGREYLHGKKF